LKLGVCSQTTTLSHHGRPRAFHQPFAGNSSAKNQSTAELPEAEKPVELKNSLEKSKEADRTSSNEELIDENAQSGTQKAQASTLAWTRNTLIAAYIL
jgi:hypothetical protein